MRLPTRPVTVTLAATLLLAACSGTAPTPAPATPTGEPPTPVIATPTPAPQGATYWLRLSLQQAIPPVNLFAFTPAALITADGRYLVPGAVPAIFPGPLVAPYFARQLTDTGRAQIVTWAKDLGLLSGKDDFTGGSLMPGGMTGRIELTVDGRLVSFTGLPDGPVSTEPGTPGAFSELWNRIVSLPQTLQAELGPEQPWTPEAYAILVGPPPEPQGGITAPVADWPLAGSLGEFGGPVQDGSYRCGLVEGADAATLRPALDAANQLTQWVNDPSTSATFGLTVRPIAAGENPCAEVFGF